MSHVLPNRRHFLHALAAAGTSCLAARVWGEEENLHQPVFRIARADFERRGDEHPLDPALRIAAETLEHVQKNIDDYTCTMVKRERIGGVLNEYEYMKAKVRNRKVKDGQVVTPLSAYLKFEKPKNIAGREVIWVEGQNNNKLVAHEGGVLIGRISVWLDPNSPLAMRGNLYPITEIGIENMVAKLIERGGKDKQTDPTGKETQVEFKNGAKLNGRLCTVLTVKHPVQRPHYDFEVAQIFLDNQLNIPVRYIAYGWPERPGEGQRVLEEYNYVDVKLNVGLTDADFDPKNKAYNFRV